MRTFPQVRLIQHDDNRGYGAALKTGFAAAQHHLIGFLDADATYPPELFPKLCSEIVADGADLVIGLEWPVRLQKCRTVRRLGNRIFRRPAHAHRPDARH